MVQVLHVLEATLGGTRRHIFDLIKGLQRHGIQQGLLYSTTRADGLFTSQLGEAVAAGLTAIEVPMARTLNVTADLRACARIRREIQSLSPRVLHLHSAKAGGLGRLAALGIEGCRVVYTPHASPANLSATYSGIERLLGAVRTDRIIALSDSEHREIGRLGHVSPGKLMLVKNGIDHDELHERARELGTAAVPSGRLILTIGRMTEQKNPQLLVSASAIALGKMPSLHFVWIGDGELRAEVEESISRAGVADKWTLTGWLPNPLPLLARAEIFALSSRYEGMPYVILEAMSLGKPVVATDVTGSRDLVVSGKTGHLVNDANSFASAIISLAQDERMLTEMGSRSAIAGTAYTLERMARETLDVYSQVGLDVPLERLPVEGRPASAF